MLIPPEEFINCNTDLLPRSSWGKRSLGASIRVLGLSLSAPRRLQAGGFFFFFFGCTLVSPENVVSYLHHVLPVPSPFILPHRNFSSSGRREFSVDPGRVALGGAVQGGGGDGIEKLSGTYSMYYFKLY